MTDKRFVFKPISYETGTVQSDNLVIVCDQLYLVNLCN